MIIGQHNILFDTVLDYVNKHIPDVIHTRYYEGIIFASCLNNNLRYIEVYSIKLSEQFITVTSIFYATQEFNISDPHCLEELTHHLQLLVSIAS